MKVCVKLAALLAERPDPLGNPRTWLDSWQEWIRQELIPSSTMWQQSLLVQLAPVA